MMKKMPLRYKSFVFRAFFCFGLMVFLRVSLPERIHAQPTPPDDPNSAPIDGGLMLLLGAGAGAGAWKLRAAAKAKRP